MSAAGRAEQIAALAEQFADYLRSQTDIDILQPGAVSDAHGPAGLLTACERLDAALSQILDLAAAYSDDPQMALEPLVLPAAALTGEYLRRAAGARWLGPEEDESVIAADDALIVVLPGGVAVDLPGVARAAILSGAPNLTAIAERAAIGPSAPGPPPGR